jgi:DNA-binding SARP family transcriptional activator
MTPRHAPAPVAAVPPGSPVALHLAGEPMLTAASGQAVPLNQRDAALLAWLAIEGPTPRARLAALLWPDSALDDARNALRQRLFRLGKLAGTEVVSGSVVLALAAGVDHDLHDAASVLGSRRDEVGGDFGRWLEAQRVRRHVRLRDAVLARADTAEAVNDFATALLHAREGLVLEPLSEEAHRRVMRLHYLAGDRASALRAFDRCEQLLKDELGTRPSTQTLALLRSVEQAALVRPRASTRDVPVSILRPPRLVGRDRERAALAQGWQGGHVVALVGEAGMGKTRLLQEFMQAQPGLVRAAGRPGDAGVPLATLARLLRAVIDGPAGAPAVALAAGTRSELTRVLPELASAEWRPAGEGQRLVMHRAIRELLASRSALTGLVVDDLHFADEASLDLLGALIDDDAAGVGGLRWVLAYRPAEAASPTAALQASLVDQARLLPVTLAPLSHAALAVLVDSLGLPGIQGEALAAGLLRRTGGNPLFVLETLKQAWVEDTLGELADAGNLPRPVSVGRLIERRVAQLSPMALAVARVAAVSGVDFGIALAAHVLQVPAMALADAVAELESAQVMRQDAFAHDLVADVVHTSVPPSVAVHTHAQVADWLQQHGGEPARIASHWIAAHQGPQALPWLQRAADAARRGVRHREYVTFLETKSNIEAAMGDTAAAFQSLHAAAEEAVAVGVDDAAGPAWCDRLDALASNSEQTVLALLLRAGMWSHARRGEQAVASGRQALALAQSIAHTRWTMQSHRVLADAHTMLGEFEASLSHGLACIVWIDDHEDAAGRAMGHGALALSLDNVGRLAEARSHHEQSVALAVQAGDLGQASTSCANLARNFIFAGRLAAADEAVARAEQLLGAYEGEALHAAALHSMRAWTQCYGGRFGAGLASAEAGLQLAQASHAGQAALSAVRLAACWWLLGQWGRLKQVLDTIVEPAAHGLAVRVGVARLRWAYARATGAGWQPALAHRQVMQDVLAQMPPGERPDLRLPLALELVDSDDPARALAQIEALRREAQGFGHDNVVLGAHLRAADVAARHDPPHARQQALAALAMHEAGVQSTAVLPAELWLRTAAALAAAGDLAHAAELAQAGCGWIHHAAEHHVPAEFSDGFLQRNPVNRELQALAARLRR